MNKTNPDVLWQQNHCGVFRGEDGGESWTHLGNHFPPIYSVRFAS